MSLQQGPSQSIPNATSTWIIAYMITAADEILEFVTVVSGCFDTNLFQYNFIQSVVINSFTHLI